MASTSRGTGAKTRKKSGTDFKDFMGGAKDFLAGEAPTLRDVIQKGLFLQEQMIMINDIDYRHIDMKKIFSSVASEVLDIWASANPQFCSPVVASKRALAERIEKSWNVLRSICHGRETKKKFVDSWNEKLDKVFDIVKCKCNIYLCSDVESCCGKVDCSSGGAHITCTCEREFKVPKCDLLWLKGQRDKVGTVSKFRFGGIDKVESERIDKLRIRKEKEEESLAKQKEKEVRFMEEQHKERLHESDSEIMEDANLEEVPDILESWDKNETPCRAFNSMDISNTASATVR